MFVCGRRGSVFRWKRDDFRFDFSLEEIYNFNFLTLSVIRQSTAFIAKFVENYRKSGERDVLPSYVRFFIFVCNGKKLVRRSNLVFRQCVKCRIYV